MNTITIQITEEEISALEWAAAIVPTNSEILTTFATKLRAAFSEVTYTHTVWCFTDKSLSCHFTDVTQATPYINKLLAQGHKAKLYDYRPKKSYTDYLIEREENQ